MSRHLFYILAAFVLATSLSACKPQVPSRYIQPDEMEDLLYDYHLAQAMAMETGGDNADGEGADYLQSLYLAAVLEKHGVTKADFDSSLTYYYIRADRFAPIYKNVAKRLSDYAAEQGASEGEINHYSRLTAGTDTVDVWRGRLSANLMPYPPYNRLEFKQEADTSFRRGDAFMFLVNSEFLYQNGAHSAEACIAIRYDNDTVVARTCHINTSGISQLRLPALKDRQAKTITGFIHLKPETEPSQALKLMVIRNIQLIKFRLKEEEAPADAVQPATAGSGQPLPGNQRLLTPLKEDTTGIQRLRTKDN